MSSLFLPQFTMKENVCEEFKEIIGMNKRVAVLYGEKAWMASENKVREGIELAQFEVVYEACYGKDATYENAQKIYDNLINKNVDCLLAIGGGKCIDTVKVAADMLVMPIYTVPSIASTCAAVTMISIMYNADGSFKDIKSLHRTPTHCFIDPKIIIDAPIKYLWAGIGDTMAKHIESSFSARNDNLNYASELGIKIGENCFYPILRDGEKALKDAKNKQVSDELVRTVQNIIISTGCVSISVGPDYNSALSHALFYGLTLRKHIEENHLHGEVVAYGTLVQLMMDKQFELLEKAYNFYKKVQLPTSLADLELDVNENLDDVIYATEINNELNHVPYKVTGSLILQAMKDLEKYNMEEN